MYKKMFTMMLALLLGLNSGYPVFAEGEETEPQPDLTETELPAAESETEEELSEETEETVLEEAEEIVTDAESFERIYDDADDFATPAVGSDGVVYEGVNYLSVGAVSRLPEETQNMYREIADDIAQRLNNGQEICDVVIAVSKTGELSYAYSLPATVYGTFGTDFVLSNEETEVEVIAPEEVPNAEETAVPEETAEETEQPEEVIEEEKEPEIPAEEAAQITEETTEETEITAEEEIEPEEISEPENTAEEVEEAPAEDEITDVQEEEETVYEIVEENMDLYESFSIPAEIVQDVEIEDHNTVLQDMNYYYDQLNSTEKALYKKGKSAFVSKGKNSFSFGASYGNYRYYGDCAFRAVDALILTYPNKFDWFDRAGKRSSDGNWYSARWAYSGGSMTVTLVKSKYYSKTLKNQMTAKVNTLVENAYNYARSNYSNNPTYGIVNYFDNWLCANNYYNYNGTYNSYKGTREYYFCHTPFGCLLYGNGVCESYALAMNALLDKAGIRNMYVVGTGNGGGHAWNNVQMPDGKWYMLDSTWDDNGTSSDKSYFLTKVSDGKHSPEGTTFTGYPFSFRPDGTWATATYSSSTTDSYFSQVRLSESVKYMKPKGSFTLKKILPENVSGVGSYYVKWPVTWTSSNPAVAKVSSKGKVTAVRPGSTIISMTIGGVKKSCTVYVYKFSKLTFNDNSKTSLSKTYEKGSNVAVTADGNIIATFTTSDIQTVSLTVNQAGEKTRTAAQIQSSTGMTVSAKSSNPAAVEVYGYSLSGDTITLRLLPKKVGKATITVKFGGKTAKLTLNTKYKLQSTWFESQSEFASRNSSIIYSGAAKKPAILKSISAPKGLKYKLTYSNNKNAGTATLTIKGTGNFAGSVTRTFTIQRAPIAKAKFAKKSQSRAYTGSALPATVAVTLGKKTLKKDVDYRLYYSTNGYSGWTTTVPVNRNTYYVQIRGIGNYTGTSEQPTLVYTIK